jgi:hypothetical protein
MKYTLLELTQTVLSRMDSDEVNSISDTPEAMQVATIIRSVYFDIIGRANLPEHFSLVTLDASTDATKPTLMTVPSTISRIEWIRYNKLNELADPINMMLLYPLSIQDFLQMNYSQDLDASNILSFDHTVGTDTYTVLYRNDKNPDYYTTFDDNTIIFDSYDADIDTTLQKSKTLCYGKSVIPFTMEDSFIPNLDEPQFALLMNEALSTAWMELKQTPHPIAERNSRRQWTHLQKSRDKVKGLTDFEQLPDFGKPGSMGYSRFWPGKYRAR